MGYSWGLNILISYWLRPKLEDTPKWSPWSCLEENMVTAEPVRSQREKKPLSHSCGAQQTWRKHDLTQVSYQGFLRFFHSIQGTILFKTSYQGFITEHQRESRAHVQSPSLDPWVPWLILIPTERHFWNASFMFIQTDPQNMDSYRWVWVMSCGLRNMYVYIYI